MEETPPKIKQRGRKKTKRDEVRENRGSSYQPPPKTLRTLGPHTCSKCLDIDSVILQDELQLVPRAKSQGLEPRRRRA